MAKFRILNVIDELNLGGTESAMVRLVSALDKTKFHPIVCSFDDGVLKRE